MEGSNDGRGGNGDGDDPPNDSSSQLSSHLDAAAASTPGDGGMNQDLPFLVTHWLANFQAAAGASSARTPGVSANNSSNVGGDAGAAGSGGGSSTTTTAAVTAGPTAEERQEAARRLHRAAGDIASAFSTLGIFGSATSAPLSNNPTLRNATYSDVSRRWPSLPPTHLETVVESSVAATAVANRLALDRARPVSIIDERGEGVDGGTAAAGGGGGGGGGGRGSSRGRRVGEGSARPNHDDNDDNMGDSVAAALSSSSSILHPPTLLTALQPPTNPTTTSSETLSNLTSEFATALGKTLDQEREESSMAPPSPPQRLITAAIGSDVGRASTEAAVASRRVTDLRSELQSITGEITSIERTISSQERTRDSMTRQREVAEAVVDGRGSAVAAEASRFLSQGSDLDLRVIDSRLQDAERVIAQMGRKLTELKITHEQKQTEYGRAAVQASDSWRRYRLLRQKFHDPFARMATSPSTSVSSLPYPFAKLDSRSGSLLSTVTGRQHSAGGSGFCHRQAGRVPSRLALKCDRKSILQNRLSHAATINCHLFYPIFSLKFDKTGKYFITGADDHLVKLFHLGAGISSTGRNSRGHKKFNYGANDRGAVLVCTLRGHAGVVTDLDVSADNALLATASEDGDVRIWGLKDGSPVAILRGHTGGANMVSWSVLTPFRIVTTGDDGLARMWDIREAALKRYGSFVGKRSDYVLPKIYDYESSDEEEESENVENNNAEDLVLPPIPLRAQEGDDEDAANGIVDPAPADGVNAGEGNAGDGNDDGDENRVIVPPLPYGAGGDFVAGLVGAGNIANGPAGSSNGNPNGNANGGAAVINPGAFVAGDEIDEGVRLIAKLQHGEVLPDSQMGTRSQRKAVQVVCIARCPIGGHFATGSDDGLGRVWADEDDERVEHIDARIGDLSRRTTASASSQSPRRRFRTSGRLKTLRSGAGSGVVGPSRANLLATLAGHLDSITDIEYSRAGDRILTASQKDGVVRIWSWGNENAPASNADAHTGRVKFDNIKQILIRLTNPAAVSQTGTTSSSSAGPSRRRGGSSSGGSDNVGVYCDSAKWISDDSKIVTSQACPLKEGAPEIVPGSQVLYVWHSRTGQCLLGMPSAHSFAASVLVSHPLDASILVSAGGDGRINVWDLDTGKKFFTHHNTLTHGPMEPPSSRGKDCVYLDGHFSPDGLNMVLTDDNGRVTILDTFCSKDAVRKMNSSTRGSSSSPTLLEGNDRTPPGWMKEQYCANDYYEMIYDAHGYCIERGSGLPPHLAPKAARCTHTGTPHPDEVTEVFNQMAGPLPLPESVCRLDRDATRLRGGNVRKNAGLLYQNVQGKRTFINVHSVDVGRYGVRSHIASVLRKMNAAIGGIGVPTEAVEDADHFGTSAAAARAATSRSPSQRQNRAGGGTSSRVGNRASSSSGRALSNNYEWGDYEDLINERPLSDEGESDDEEYNAAPRARGRRLNGTDNDDSGSDSSDGTNVDSDDGEGGSGRRRSRRRRRNDSQSSSRSRRRNRGSNSRRRSRSIRFDEEAPRQPSRTSSRQQDRSRRVYDVPDSDDDDLVEMMSTNTSPTGEYVDDYNVLGHLFRLPEGGRIHRAWVTRMESHLGLCGKKTYAPQVGDSVVYIPKAHYDTVKEYPTGNNSSAPWKSWPKSSAWPVVRCTVKNVRYRFPYEQYYRSRGGDAIISVVAILKLEVTGIPLITSSSDSSFPWPKPEFISRQTRSSSITFEVSLFENGEVDFIVPEHLYIWKIQSLQDAISSRRNAHGLQYTSYFQPSGDDEGAGVEDAEYTPYGSEISDMVFGRREREIHFQNSGYSAFGIVWDSGESGLVSAWEGVLTEKVNDFPPAPSLEDDEKTELLRILDKLEEDPLVESLFSHPVDTNMFTDYNNMIEVPMDLSIIRTRLELNYYTNVLSTMADFRLLRDNCIKYNERNADVTEAACDLYNKFEDMSSDLREKASARYPIPSNRQRTDADEVQQQPPSPSRSTRTSRRAAAAAAADSSSRLPEFDSPTRSSHRPLRSSLEGLPPPLHEDEESDAEPESQARSSRRRLRINLSASAAANRSSTRSLRSTRGAVAATEESGEEENGSSDDDEIHAPSEGRRRSTRSAAPLGTSSPSRSSKRTSTRSSPRRERQGQNVSYEEVDSDADAQGSPAEEDSDSGDAHESESSEEEEEDEEMPLSRSQRLVSRRAAAQPSSSRAVGARSSQRSRRKRSSCYVEVESEEELYQSGGEEEEEDEASSEDDEEPTRRGTKRASAALQGRRSPRRSAAARRQESSDDDSSISGPSGGESGSEEEEDDQDHSDDASSDGSDEYVSGNGPSRASTKRRKRSTGAQSSAKKKSKTEGGAKKGGDLFYPNLSKWPPVVEVKDITKIAKNILEVCREADTEQIFATPVTEAFPEVADAYLNVISDPIDFRTIEEERLPTYQDMQELQDDLIQVFRNCCVYNGEGSDFYHYAISIWNGLNSVFKEVCEVEGIMMPRRWS